MAVLGRRQGKLAIPKLEPRLTVLSILMMVVLGAVALRLYYLQIIETHQMSSLADRNRIRIRRIPASRGLIFDRRHRVLVDTRPSYDAVLVPEDLRNRAVTIHKLEQFIGGDLPQISYRLVRQRNIRLHARRYFPQELRQEQSQVEFFHFSSLTSGQRRKHRQALGQFGRLLRGKFNLLQAAMRIVLLWNFSQRD